MGSRFWAGAAAVAALASLTACDASPEAPTNPQYCWRMINRPDGKPDFVPVSNGVKNLETCAANLEAVSMRDNRPLLTGAYQGQFIFITPDMVQSSMRLDGARYRLFDAETRGKIDHDLRWMLQDEKHPSKFGPQAGSRSGTRGGNAPEAR